MILIDIAREHAQKLDSELQIATPFRANLYLKTQQINGADLLIWQLSPSDDDSRADAAWSAAFDLSWLIGHLHELTVFKARVEEYQHTGRPILSDLVRTSIKIRNNQFGKPRFGGWETQKVVAAAVHNLWIARGETKAHLNNIQSLVEDPRDAAGITGNIVKIVNIAEKISMTGDTTYNFSGSFTGSNLIVASQLTNVAQNVGTLPNADSASKQELQKLIVQLHDELQRVPAASQQQAEAVSVTTARLVETAKEPNPNRTLLKIAIDGAKGAAETLKEAAPSVISIVTTIAGLIGKLHGL